MPKGEPTARERLRSILRHTGHDKAGGAVRYGAMLALEAAAETANDACEDAWDTRDMRRGLRAATRAIRALIEEIRDAE